MRRIVGYASAILMMTAAAAAASEFVVIAADNGGKAYTPGAVVKAGSKVVLPAGARITLLAQSGKVVTLKGPHDGVVRAAARGGRAEGEIMLNLLAKLANDDAGFVVSAELVLIGTITVLTMVVGLAEVAYSVNSELSDVANAFDAVNQSYEYQDDWNNWSYQENDGQANASTVYLAGPIDE